MNPIIESLKKAEADHAAHQARIATIMERHDSIAQWQKVVLCGDVFWTNGKKHLTSKGLLNTLGKKLVKCGALSEADYYG